MLTFFNAEVNDNPSFYKNGVIVKVQTLVNDKIVEYNVEISPHQLVADGFIDLLMEQFKRKIKEKIKEIAPQNAFEASEQQTTAQGEKCLCLSCSRLGANGGSCQPNTNSHITVCGGYSGTSAVA